MPGHATRPATWPATGAPGLTTAQRAFWDQSFATIVRSEDLSRAKNARWSDTLDPIARARFVALSLDARERGARIATLFIHAPGRTGPPHRLHEEQLGEPRRRLLRGPEAIEVARVGRRQRVVVRRGERLACFDDLGRVAAAPALAGHDHLEPHPPVLTSPRALIGSILP